MARPTQRRGNYPAEVTSFIGRRHELAEVRRKLAEGRLISLVGPGGVGKTRLAVRAVTDLGRGYRDGGWIVELAELVDPSLLSNAIVAALDLRDQAAEPRDLLLAYLRDKDVLLVLDNCEHVLDAVAELVTDILKIGPGLRVITTSRQPLSVLGEHVVPVPPLQLPESDGDEPLARLAQNEAVKLFTERAAAASGGFGLTSSNRAAIVDLCRRLDGVPLAIELAAVRTRVLTVEQMLDRLADRFSLLTGGSRAALPRHQTLRTTIEWSHDLLSDDERSVLRRMCVFAGRFTLGDVEAVCAAELAGTPLDVLSSLVDKSLVTREDAGEVACYRLHETMREFARLKLQAAGESEAVEQRCAEHYWSSCMRASLDNRYRLVAWLEWAELEIDNIRAMFRWFQARGETARGIELAVALGWYWITRATTEGMRLFDELFAAGGSESALLGWAYFLRGFLAVEKVDPIGARSALRRAVDLGRTSGQRDLLAEALPMAANAEHLAGDFAAAQVLIAEAEINMAEVDYRAAPLNLLQAKSLKGFFEVDLDAVRSASSAGARLAREMGDTYVLAIMLLNLGSAELLGGAPEESAPLLAEALEIAYQLDDRVAEFYLLDGFGCLAALTGDARRAARLFGAADSVRASAGADVMPFLAPLLAEAKKSVIGALGASYDVEFEAGRRLRRERAVGLALGRLQDAERAGEPGESNSGPLAQREAEVARLVADGLTNKEIGLRLFISERTVDSHVRSILNKLGFSTRSQIAAWMAAANAGQSTGQDG